MHLDNITLAISVIHSTIVTQISVNQYQTAHLSKMPHKNISNCITSHQMRHLGGFAYLGPLYCAMNLLQNEITEQQMQCATIHLL